MPNELEQRLMVVFAAAKKGRRKAKAKTVKPPKEPPSSRTKKKSRSYRNKLKNNGLLKLKRETKSPFTKLSDSKPLEKRKAKTKERKVTLEENPTTKESLERLMRNLEHHMENKSTRVEHKSIFSKMRRQIKGITGVYPSEKDLKIIKPQY